MISCLFFRPNASTDREEAEIVVPVVIKNFLRLKLFIIAIFDDQLSFNSKGYTC